MKKGSALEGRRKEGLVLPGQQSRSNMHGKARQGKAEARQGKGDEQREKGGTGGVQGRPSLVPICLLSYPRAERDDGEGRIMQAGAKRERERG